jgi:hypothetical protein
MRPWFAVIALGLIGASLMGCAQDPWVKPGATQQDAAQAVGSCESAAEQAYFGPGRYGFGAQSAVYNMNRQAWVERCVRSQGFTRASDARRPG